MHSWPRCGTIALHSLYVLYEEGESVQDILKALETLTGDELETLIERAEELLRERLAEVPRREDPAIGMWKDREDMQDSAAWVRKLRQSEGPNRV